MKVAAIDLGTNTFLCLIAEVENGSIIKVYEDHAKVVRLGQNVNQSKKFHPEALLRARLCLSEFAELIKLHRPERVLAMATSAARDVTNSEELFQIGKELQIPIEIIPGEKEAEITFNGATADLEKDNRTRLVIDIGGGSTEFILGTNHQVQYAKSLDIGCVRLNEKYIFQQPTPQLQIDNLQKLLVTEIGEIREKILSIKPYEVIAVAGTPSALASIEVGGFSSEKINGYVFTKPQLQLWFQKLIKLSVAEKIELGFEPGRADVILSGVSILLTSMDILKLNQIKVSTKGVRFGVALEVSKR